MFDFLVDHFCARMFSLYPEEATIEQLRMNTPLF